MDQLFALGHVPGNTEDARLSMSTIRSLCSSLPVQRLSCPRFLPDNFTLALIGTVAAASLLPCRGTAAVTIDRLTDLAITTGVLSKWLAFERADRVTIIFCGSRKSLSQGVTMAKVIFASHAVGGAILPPMLFHQIQLMVCAALAQRWGRHTEPIPCPASTGAKPLLPH
jgi:predicted Na+-dependent transporter